MHIPAAACATAALIAVLSHSDTSHIDTLAARVETSVAAVRQERARFVALRNAEGEFALTAYERRRTREFVAARNAESVASMAASEGERMRLFAAARNAEIEMASAAAETERTRVFAAARNSEIESAMTTVAFARARNAEIELASAAAETERTRVFAAARNAEIEVAAAAVEQQRLWAFAEARNAEINVAMSAHDLERATLAAGAGLERMTVALAAPMGPQRIETGSVDSAGGESLTPGQCACRGLAEGVGPVVFGKASTNLDRKGQKAIDEVTRIAATCAGTLIEVHGHTDATGSASANRRLSEQRARAVAERLIGAGIEPRRIVIIGHGDTAPILPNTTAENRARNRRIEFTLKDATATSRLETK